MGGCKYVNVCINMWEKSSINVCESIQPCVSGVLYVGVVPASQHHPSLPLRINEVYLSVCTLQPRVVPNQGAGVFSLGCRGAWVTVPQ